MVPGMTLVASLKTRRAVLKARKSSDTGAATSPSFKSNAALLFRTYTRRGLGHQNENPCYTRNVSTASPPDQHE